MGSKSLYPSVGSSGHPSHHHLAPAERRTGTGSREEEGELKTAVLVKAGMLPCCHMPHQPCNSGVHGHTGPWGVTVHRRPYSAWVLVCAEQKGQEAARVFLGREGPSADVG